MLEKPQSSIRSEMLDVLVVGAGFGGMYMLHSTLR